VIELDEIFEDGCRVSTDFHGTLGVSLDIFQAEMKSNKGIERFSSFLLCFV
jgi:hypothetical protein